MLYITIKSFHFFEPETQTSKRGTKNVYYVPNRNDESSQNGKYDDG